MQTYAALIPIKDHSERVAGKNFRRLGDMPLWEHVVETLSAMKEIGEIVIDTDSNRFTGEALAPYPKVRIVERPQELRGDFVATNRIFAYDLTQIAPQCDQFLQTHVTNPLLTAATIGRAMAEFEAALGSGAADSLFSVTAHHARFYRPGGEPINHKPGELLRTQDLEPVLEENSNLYLFTRASFGAHGRRIGERPIAFEMDRLEATDIDDETTWRLAEALIVSKRGRQ